MKGNQSPCNKNNPALLAVLLCYIIKVINSISALISGQTGREIFIAISWFTKLLHNHLLLLLLDLENNETVSPFCLQIQKPQLAVIMHSHPRCCVCLQMGRTTSKQHRYLHHKLLNFATCLIKYYRSKCIPVGPSIYKCSCFTA